MRSPKQKRTRKSKSDFFQQAAQEYMRLHGLTEFDPLEVAEWMVNTGQYSEVPRSIITRCKQELTKALRSQRLEDNQGREVRAMLCARHRNAQGNFWSIWAPLFQATPQHARLALQQWRRGIRGEVLLHDNTTRSYNDNNIYKATLDLFDYDMNKDRDEAAMPDQYPDERPSEDDQGESGSPAV